MLASLLFGVVASLVLGKKGIDATTIIYWVELIALSAFGVAWIVAGKVLKILTDDKDLLRLS